MAVNLDIGNMNVELREEDNTLYAGAKTGNKHWLAVLTDTHPKYNYDREFVCYQKPRTSNRDSGTTTVKNGTVIEHVRYTHSGKNRKDRYYQLVDDDVYQIDEVDVKAAIGGEIIPEIEEETHECEECGKEFDSEHGLAVHDGMVHKADDQEEATASSTTSNQPVVADGGEDFRVPTEEDFHMEGGARKIHEIDDETGTPVGGIDYVPNFPFPHYWVSHQNGGQRWIYIVIDRDDSLVPSHDSWEAFLKSDRNPVGEPLEVGELVVEHLPKDGGIHIESRYQLDGETIVETDETPEEMAHRLLHEMAGDQDDDREPMTDGGVDDYDIDPTEFKFDIKNRWKDTQNNVSNYLCRIEKTDLWVAYYTWKTGPSEFDFAVKGIGDFNVDAASLDREMMADHIRDEAHELSDDYDALADDLVVHANELARVAAEDWAKGVSEFLSDRAYDGHIGVDGRLAWVGHEPEAFAYEVERALTELDIDDSEGWGHDIVKNALVAAVRKHRDSWRNPHAEYIGYLKFDVEPWQLEALELGPDVGVRAIELEKKSVLRNKPELAKIKALSEHDDSLTQQEIAGILGKDRTTVSRQERLIRQWEWRAEWTVEQNTDPLSDSFDELKSAVQNDDLHIHREDEGDQLILTDDSVVTPDEGSRLVAVGVSGDEDGIWFALSANEFHGPGDYGPNEVEWSALSIGEAVELAKRAFNHEQFDGQPDI